MTEAYFAKIPQRDVIKNRLTKLWNYEKYSAPFKAGKHYFYSKNNGLQNQNVLYIADSITDQGRVFFDPTQSPPAEAGGLLSWLKPRSF